MPVARFVMVTLAFGTAAPVASAIVPTRLPSVACPKLTMAKTNSARTNARTGLRISSTSQIDQTRATPRGEGESETSPATLNRCYINWDDHPTPEEPRGSHPRVSLFDAHEVDRFAGVANLPNGNRRHDSGQAGGANLRTGTLWSGVHFCNCLHIAQPVGALEHVSRLAAVRRPDDSVTLHHIEDARGAAVAQSQMTLQRGSGRLAHLQDQPHGLFVQGILLFAGNIAFHGAFLFAGRRDEERLVVFGSSLLPPALHHAVDFGLGDEGAVQAREP